MSADVVRTGSPWRGPAGLSALAVLVVTAFWRGVLLNGSFFNQDDYYLTTRALDVDPWSWSYLMEPVAGHVMPLQHATYWLVAHHLPFDWPTISLMILGVQLASGVVAWHLLSRLLPGRWARVPLLALLMWAPLTLATTLWWSASMGLWPHVLMALVATLFLVRQRLSIGSGWVNLGTCLLATAVGLAWHERSVLIAPLLATVAVAMSDARGWRRLTETVRRLWPLWLAYLVGMSAYLWLHVQITTVDAGTAPAREYLALSGTYIFENALPGMVGGPWFAELKGGAVIPPIWVSVVSGLLVLLVVAVLLRRGRADARWALVVVVVYVLIDLALVLAGRAGFGRILGYDPRYSADLVLPAVVAVALALRASPPRERRLPQRWHLPAGFLSATVATALVLVACVVGTMTLVPHFQNDDDRDYWANVREGLARDPSQVLLDEYVPTDILLPLLEDEAQASSVFAPLPETPVFDEPSPRLRTITESGELEAVTVLLPTSMRPGPDEGCGYAVSSAPRTVRMRRALDGRFVMRVSYFTDVVTEMEVEAGTYSTRFRTGVGPNDVWIVVPEQDEVRGIRFSRDDPTSRSTVCIAGLVAGIPEAS
ncbi:hypothetical protein [Nocardioides baculatus]|uniref:DUF2079 domain-containing protein n=1 Tax=Nocardioides baculatus TaxID=2801337 RepID=A0ABS1L926_9ACTN|nr:hypothetical protein [Nocardioides baculatus]MBL0748194.1 hypothetical protein [Nocardioides baculatus]